MRTLGQRVFQMDAPAGFAAQLTAGAVIWGSTKAGYPLSTTHVVSGAVMGSGATKRLSAVRWGVAGNIVLRVGPDDPGCGSGRAAHVVAGRGDLLDADRLRHRLERDLRPAGAGRRGGARRQPCRRAADPQWPTGRRRRRSRSSSTRRTGSSRSSSAQTNSLFITPYDRDDLMTLAFAVDDVADAGENAAELFGLYSVESPTKQAIELCGLSCGERAPRVAARESQGPARLVGRDPRDQGDRGRGGRRRPRRARDPLQGRPHRPGDRDPLEGHLRGARGSGRRLRDRRAPRRQHPRQERVARHSGLSRGCEASLNSRNSPVTR